MHTYLKINKLLVELNLQFTFQEVLTNHMICSQHDLHIVLVWYIDECNVLIKDYQTMVLHNLLVNAKIIITFK